MLEFGKNPFNTDRSKLAEICKFFNFDNTVAQKEHAFVMSKIILIENLEEKLEILKETELLKKIYSNILSMFASSYNCESAFSSLNFILNCYRSVLTQQNTENCLILATSSIEIEISDLISAVQCQQSH